MSVCTLIISLFLPPSLLPLSPSPLSSLHSYPSPSFPPLAWQQHDVQELCRVMFDALERQFQKDKYERPNLINELYQGTMKDYVKCLKVRERGGGEGTNAQYNVTSS